MKSRTVLTSLAAAAVTAGLALAPSPAKADHVPCLNDWKGDVWIETDDGDIHTKHYVDPGKVDGTCDITP